MRASAIERGWLPPPCGVGETLKPGGRSLQPLCDTPVAITRARYPLLVRAMHKMTYAAPCRRAKASLKLTVAGSRTRSSMLSKMTRPARDWPLSRPLAGNFMQDRGPLSELTRAIDVLVQVCRGRLTQR